MAKESREWSTPFRDHVRPLTADEKNALETNIKSTGRILSPVVLTTAYEILDGHNRYDIGIKLGLPIPMTILKESKDWTNEQKRWKVEEFAIASRNLSVLEIQSIWADRRKRMQVDREAGMSDTAIGKKHGISRQRVAQVLDYSERKSPCGRNKPDARRKLSDEDKEDIRERVASGERQEDVAEEYSVSQSAVSKAVAVAYEPDEEIVESDAAWAVEILASMKSIDVAIDALYEHWEVIWLNDRKVYASFFSSCKSQMTDVTKTWKSWKRTLTKEIKNASS